MDTEVCRRDGGCSLKDAGWHGSRTQFPSSPSFRGRFLAVPSLIFFVPDDVQHPKVRSKGSQNFFEHQDISWYPKSLHKWFQLPFTHHPAIVECFICFPFFFTSKTLEVSTFNDYLRFLIMIRNFGELGSSCEPHLTWGVFVCGLGQSVMVVCVD